MIERPAFFDPAKGFVRVADPRIELSHNELVLIFMKLEELWKQCVEFLLATQIVQRLEVAREQSAGLGMHFGKYLKCFFGFTREHVDGP